MAEENKKAVPAKTSTAAVKNADEKLSFWKRVTKWFRDMKSELHKVIWPTPKAILNNTTVALALMAVSAVALWVFDKLASLGVETIFKLVG